MAHAAAGANTLNCVADADIDKVMKRTARRPLATAGGAAQPRPDVRAGAVGGVVLLAVVDRPTCCRPTWPPTIAFYVLVYAAAAQAPDVAERGVGGAGLHAGDDRLVGGDRHHRLARRW